MKTYSLKLSKLEDLIFQIEEFFKKNYYNKGVIVLCIGVFNKSFLMNGKKVFEGRFNKGNFRDLFFI